MTKFDELSIVDLHDIVIRIDSVFAIYGIEKASRDAFWECIDIGNKKFDLV